MNAPGTPRIGRRVAVTLGALLVALAVGVAIGEVTGWPLLRQPLQDTLNRTLAVPVKLDGTFHARLLWQPQLQVQRLTLGAGGGLPLPHLLDAQQVDLAWRWRDLWAGWRGDAPWRLERLRAAALDAQIVRTADGRASWQIGRATPKPEPAAKGGTAPMPEVGWLQIDRGHIVIDDAPLQTRLVADLRGGEGLGSDGGRPADAREAGYRATVEGRYRALPLQMTLRTGAALPLVRDGDDATLVTLQIEGRAGAAQIAFDGRAGALLGRRPLDGALRFRGPSLAPVGEPFGVTLPETPPFELQGRLQHRAGVWQLQARRAAIGESLLNGEFRFDTNPATPKLDGRLAGPKLALADLGPAVGTTPPSAAASAPARAASAARAGGGRVLPQRRFDLPSLKAMDADVQLAIDELRFGSASVRPLRELRGRVELAGGVLQLHDLRALVAGGRVRADSRYDPNRPPPQWTLDLGFDQVEIASWLSGLRKDDGAPATPQRAYVTGQLAGTVQARGSGSSTAEILSTLDGRAQATLRNGTISHLITEAAGLDLAQAVGLLVKGDDPLPLRCAIVDLTLRDGVAITRNAVLDNRDSTVRIGGQIDLRDESLALRLNVRPKDVSPLSLRTPVTVTGTLGAPAIGVDSKRLAGKVLGSVALGTLVAPLAALLPLVDRGAHEADPCADAPPPGPVAAASAPAPAAVR